MNNSINDAKTFRLVIDNVVMIEGLLVESALDDLICNHVVRYVHHPVYSVIVNQIREQMKGNLR